MFPLLFENLVFHSPTEFKFRMSTFVKNFLPGTPSFLLFAFAVGLLLLWKSRTKRVGRIWLTVLFALYAVFSIPLTARWLAAPLSWGFHPLEKQVNAGDAKAIVVLDGGTARFRNQQQLIELPLNTTAYRALEAIRIYRLLEDPLVVVSGGDDQPDPSWGLEASALRHQIFKAGIPDDHIVLDSQSLNTREHAVNIMQILQARGIHSFVLVTSPSHMRRAMLAFHAEGANPIPSPCQGSLDRHQGWSAIAPTQTAIEFTVSTMHEYVGLLYYSLRRYF